MGRITSGRPRGSIFAPDKVHSINQGVGRFLQFRRAGQTIDGYIVEFDLLRRKAEPGMQIGGGFPEACVPVLCMQQAALSRHEKSLASASRQKSLALTEVAMTMRRLSGRCRCAARQDVLAVADVYESFGSEKRKEARARAAYKTAKKPGLGQEKGDWVPKKGSARVKGDGLTADGFNRRTELRNRRYNCESE